jgi:thiamine-monophosphate kinase
MNDIDLNNLGEFGLIEKLAENVQIYNSETVKGIGDDAAVIDNGDKYTLVSTDMLLEGVHFDLSYVPLKHLGYKAVAVNVSDIAAMNGIPKQITVSIGISSRFGFEAISALYEGIYLACENYKVDLVGGDTTASRTGLTISITAIGEVEKDKIAYRKGAKANDIVCVSGDLGAAYLGLQILEREKSVFMANPNMQPDLDKNEYVVGRQLKPDGRTDVIYEMKEKGLIPTSMIDISDGLASEILHLSKSSGKGFTVFVDNLPIDNQTLMAANEFNINPITVVMNGGEDYELLMTFSQSDYDKVKSIPEITPIGFVTEEINNILVLNSGERSQIVAQGWKHFES